MKREREREKEEAVLKIKKIVGCNFKMISIHGLK
jgi:hypothetical protein